MGDSPATPSGSGAAAIRALSRAPSASSSLGSAARRAEGAAHLPEQFPPWPSIRKATGSRILSAPSSAGRRPDTDAPWAAAPPRRTGSAPSLLRVVAGGEARLPRVTPGMNLTASVLDITASPSGRTGDFNRTRDQRRPSRSGTEDGGSNGTQLVPDVDTARTALADAKKLLKKQGQEARVVDLLVRYLESCGISGASGEGSQEGDAADLVAFQQDIIALCCWLCNSLATQYLRTSKVARAFACTRTCEKWLKFRRVRCDDDWLRLRFDCAFNAAELAKASDDLPQAVKKLWLCARLQSSMRKPANPEIVHISLSETLLQCESFAEAAQIAHNAVEILKCQQIDKDERKRYALLFALTLEQASLSSLDFSPGSGAPERAMACLAEAEMASFRAPCDEPTPVDEAARALLEQMRRLHCQLLDRLNGVALKESEAPDDASELEGDAYVADDPDRIGEPVSLLAL